MQQRHERWVTYVESSAIFSDAEGVHYSTCTSTKREAPRPQHVNKSELTCITNILAATPISVDFKARKDTEGGAGTLMAVGCAVRIVKVGILVGVSDIVVIRGLCKDFVISGYPRRLSSTVNGSVRALLKYLSSESLRSTSWPLFTDTSQVMPNTAFSAGPSII
jgi:hypothetical protein